MHDVDVTGLVRDSDLARMREAYSMICSGKKRLRVGSSTIVAAQFRRRMAALLNPAIES
jgi:hypothetical protein